MACRIWVAGCAAVLGTSVGCGRTPAADKPVRRGTSAIMLADTATLTVPRSYSAQVYVEQDVVVAARSSGVIDSLFVNLGAAVRGDQPLATIESQDQEIALAQIELVLDRARNMQARAVAMGPTGGIASADSELVVFEFQQAEQRRRQARRDLDLTRIVAPFAGVVTARYAAPHQLVKVGDTLFRVAATAPQLLRLRIPEGAARSVARGDRAEVVAADAGSTARRIAVGSTVTFVAPALDAASGTREVILQLATAAFLPGEGAIARLGSERRPAIVVPQAAVSPDGYVLVIDGDRTIIRPVVVGTRLADGRVEILSGVAGGERLAPIPR